MSDTKVKVTLVEDTYDAYRIGGQIGSTIEVSRELADKMVASKHAAIAKDETKK